jgi:hypothetical protein
MLVHVSVVPAQLQPLSLAEGRQGPASPGHTRVDGMPRALVAGHVETFPEKAVTVSVYVPFCGMHAPPSPGLPPLLPLLPPESLPEPLSVAPLLEPVSATEPSSLPPELLPLLPPLLAGLEDELHAVVDMDDAHEPAATMAKNPM